MSRATEQDAVLGSLVTLAKARNTALITYKKPGEDWITERAVEPYELTHNAQENIIVLTWQLSPCCDEPSWRNFRVDRITSVKHAGGMFNPRIAVSIDDGSISRFTFGKNGSGKSKPSAAEKYFRYVEKAMLDGQMTKRELSHAKKLSADLRLGQVKSVHAQAYANLLGEVTMDGELTPEEEDMLVNMRVFLGELGWAP